MTTRLPSLRIPPIGFAHRGARALAPDNTMEAFDLAVSMGATGLETDAWITADGVAVLDHDGWIGNRIRRKGVGELNRDELPGHIPTFSELISSLPEPYDISIDVKDDAAFEAIIDDARAANVVDRTWLCHPDLDVLIEWRHRVPDVRLVNSTRLDRLPRGPEQRAAELARHRIDAVNMHRSDWSGGLTTLFHRFDVLTFGWDAQHDRHLAELIDAGIDGVFSDHVDRMMAMIAEYY